MKSIQMPTGIFLGEDLYVLIKILHFSENIIKFNKAFYYYRQENNNGSHKVRMQNFYDLDFVFNELKNFLTLHYPNNKIMHELLMSKRLLHINYLGRFLFYKPQLNNQKYIDIFDMLKKDINYLRKSEKYKKLNIKYKILLNLICNIKNNHICANVLYRFFKINCILSKRKLNEFDL